MLRLKEKMQCMRPARVRHNVDVVERPGLSDAQLTGSVAFKVRRCGGGAGTIETAPVPPMLMCHESARSCATAADPPGRARSLTMCCNGCVSATAYVRARPRTPAHVRARPRPPAHAPYTCTQTCGICLRRNDKTGMKLRARLGSKMREVRVFVTLFFVVRSPKLNVSDSGLRHLYF